jgi:hypothetical protein
VRLQSAVTRAAGRPPGAFLVRKAEYGAEEGLLPGTQTPYRLWKEVPHSYQDLSRRGFRYVIEARVHGITLLEAGRFVSNPDLGPINSRLHPGVHGRISILDLQTGFPVYSEEFDYINPESKKLAEWAAQPDDVVLRGFASAIEVACSELAEALFKP